MKAGPKVVNTGRWVLRPTAKKVTPQPVKSTPSACSCFAFFSSILCAQIFSSTMAFIRNTSALVKPCARMFPSPVVLMMMVE